MCGTLGLTEGAIVSLEDFTRFMGEIEHITPAIGDAMEADGESRTPDMETPVLWMAWVGHAISVTLAELTVGQHQAVFDAIERGMRSRQELLRTALATGLLEAMANDMDRGVVDRGLVATLLGSESRAYMDAWDEFTLGPS